MKDSSGPKRREAILRAAATAIAERGVRGLRVSDVAEVAGVSPGLLYYHFKDRDGLLAAALAYINDRARSYRTATDPGDSARERLIRQVLDEIQDRPEVRENSLAWNELRACAVYEQTLRAPLTRTSLRWTAEIADAIRLAQALGEIADTLDPDHLGGIATALTEGLSSRWLSGEISTEQARTQLRTALEALLPQPISQGRGRRSAATHG
ncbi:TetR/AcrR family transcriptional regulator [Nocardia acidivorans]|uniref:TetR/AcrR family transcriptional regulator n=1 Tax=Nocardia acidivorans TaxID=404580 RepID=UPI00083155C1|nr:TetR/AcrR family transcriptional regulator [Nocardia acidivorans]